MRIKGVIEKYDKYGTLSVSDITYLARQFSHDMCQKLIYSWTNS